MSRIMGRIKNLEKSMERTRRDKVIAQSQDPEQPPVMLDSGLVIAEESTTEFRALMSRLIRKEKLKGREHLVIPVVMMTEGVHNGVFYSGEELAKFPGAWNGRPVVVYHPRHASGEPISATTSPKVFERTEVGKIFNATFKDGKLKAEAWVDPDEAVKVNEDLITLLEKGENIDVSIGVFQEEAKTQGVWGKESYSRKALNLRPDHLAALPYGRGACSWADGAGMPRINAKKKTEEGGEMKKTEGDEGDGSLEVMSEALALAFSGLRPNEMSHEQLRDELSKQLRTKLALPKPGATNAPGAPSPEWVYLREVYDGSFIFERTGGSFTGGPRLFRQDYKKGKDGIPSLEGMPVEVRERREYVPVTNGPAANDEGSNNNERGSAHLEEDMDRKQTVDGLVASGRWPAEDREMLVAMEDKVFGRVLATLEPKTVESVGDSNLAPASKALVTEALAVHAEQKTALIGRITACKRNTFKPEVLQTKGIEELTALAALAEGETAPAAPAAAPRVAIHGAAPAAAAGGPGTVTVNDDAPKAPALFPKV